MRNRTISAREGSQARLVGLPRTTPTDTGDGDVGNRRMGLCRIMRRVLAMYRPRARRRGSVEWPLHVRGASPWPPWILYWAAIGNSEERIEVYELRSHHVRIGLAN